MNHLDGFLYVGVAICAALTASLNTDEASTIISTVLLFWLKLVAGATGAGLLAGKMYRSRTFADKQDAAFPVAATQALPEANPADNAIPTLKPAVGILIALLIISAASPARALLIGNAAQIVCATNGAVMASSAISVQVPGFVENISGLTNGATQFTNNIIQSFTTNGVTYTITASSIVSAGGLTNNFSVTNQSVTITVPTYTILQIYPQGPSNNFSMTAQ